MKKIILFLITTTIFGCSTKNELYKETDSFVQSLETEYESYGFSPDKYSKTTSDGLYTISPIGRLINVKIQKIVNTEEYEDLKNDLEDHYKGDTRVNSVYICQAGTIMIDCRN
ncbi:ABC transporter [Flavobacterium ustbae]|uniref:ABC transporter n=1 Tax=Flavobacterium ustbae TaxID=2488790 RepID=UPI000F7A7C03|nr:ABC transporter [Flavobacterium ustbae]